jgi:hypothetical protein
MTAARTLIAVFLAVTLAACARSYQVVSLPQHEADLYPVAQRQGGIAVAIDEMRNPARATRYFGADLVKEGILPVTVVVSNTGKQRVAVKPSDILVYRGHEIVDPLPVEMVAAAAKRQHGSLRSATEREVDRFFEKTTFKETILGPNESYRGVMFFALPEPHKRDRFFASWSAFREGGLRVRIGLTDTDTGERLLFGPFSLSHPQGSLLSSYHWR